MDGHAFLRHFGAMAKWAAAPPTSNAAFRREAEDRLPHFLIVGAMKAGTTTLYRDLCRSPQIFMPEQKEPNTLARLTDPAAIVRDYATLFPRSSVGKIRGEASTTYTKRPKYDGVAERAHAVCGGDLRIVYLRRDPIQRIVSHFRHEVQLGLLASDFSEALRAHPFLIEYSRYDWQIAPWKELFGDDHVLELDLQELAANRRETVERVLAHIGGDPALLPELDLEENSNEAGDKNPMRNPLLKAFIFSRAYQRRIKPFLPRALRTAARRTVLPPAQEVPVHVTDADRAFIAERLSRPPSACA